MNDNEHICSAIPLEGNGARPSHRGEGYSVSDSSFTLNSVEVHAVAYCVCSYDSNSMKSSNPHSGFYEADTSRCLDNNGGNPSCLQGGEIIVEIDKATPSPAYTLKVRGGVSVDSKGKAAGKGALIQTEKAGCIGAAQDQYLFQPVKIEVSKPKNE